MIHEVRIKNVLSFREEQVLSFEASADRAYQDLYGVEIKPSMKLLKLGIVYGANASGKTNLLAALNLLRKAVLEPKTDKFEKTGFVPFLLDEQSKREDGSYYLSFFIGSTRYIYTLALNEEHISEERLVYYPGSQPALIFERAYDRHADISRVEFGNKLKISNREAVILEGNTIKNSTLLSAYNRSNVAIDLLEEVVNWFKSSFMNTITPSTELTAWTSRKLEESPQRKRFVVDILQKADFNIRDIIIEEKEEHLTEALARAIQDEQNMTAAEKEKLLKERSIKLKNISFLHATESGEHKLPIAFQSSGTMRYYGLGGVLDALLEAERFLPIDELENSLHFELINHFIKTFLVNAKRSQLLFTTHNINILMEDFIRRDAVWFCEKNAAGATELFSASDFSLHKNVSLFNAYRIGKLGAKPVLGDIYLRKNGEKAK
jgi:uncharacterized protein